MATESKEAALKEKRKLCEGSKSGLTTGPFEKMKNCRQIVPPADQTQSSQSTMWLRAVPKTSSLVFGSFNKN